ncbi:MAG: DegT/DnrJ/EryC1/StrS family aminotransferase [Saprospiraceae bacterium]|nr:DegT/DnrJ/EryC1/StrS family aminotransferase [Saprospiraceae bacterium]
MAEVRKVPFTDLHRQYSQLKQEIYDSIEAVFEASAFTAGPFVQEFEHQFAKYCNTQGAVGVSSGTSALHLALRCLGVGPGDEVIVPANTFIASAWAPIYMGANPVFVDCDEFYNLDINKVEAAITKRTCAIICVHLYGHPCDMYSLKEIGMQCGVNLIEDAAQAHGAKYHGLMVGGIAELGCFSFYPSKNLGGAGEGGAVVTQRENYAAQIRMLRNQGAPAKHQYSEIGYNYRMDGIQAAILQVKLQHLDRWNIRRRDIASRYEAKIENGRIQTPKVADSVEHAFHLYVVSVDDQAKFTNHLSNHQVSYGLHYPIPCHLQKAFTHLGNRRGDFPYSEYLAAHGVSLPIFPELTDDEIDYVIEVVNRYK